MNKIIINDDFDLKKIADSGQSFRIKEIEKNFYRFCSGDKILYISEEGNSFSISTINSNWEDYWDRYFDLNLNYSKIRKEITGKDPYIDKAIEFSKGIRILRQDPYETLLSFIIAQRKTIPSITTCIENIAMRYGRTIETPYETVFTFPTLSEISEIQLEELLNFKLGYRAKYFKNAIEFINERNLDFKELRRLSTNELLKELVNFYGVGDKIANCIALFSYHRLEAVPIDVWIQRSIDENFNSLNPFEKYGKYAGLVQQYLFYYERNKDKG